MARRAKLRWVSGVTGASLLGGIMTLAGSVQSAQLATAASAGIVPFTANYQLNCNIPVVGNDTFGITLAGDAPQSVFQGQQFYITNLSAQVTVPATLVSIGASLLKATSMSLGVSQLTFQDNGNPASIEPNYGNGNGSLQSSSAQISNGTSSVVVSVPDGSSFGLGPFVANSTSAFHAGLGAVSLNPEFMAASGGSAIGASPCAVSSGPAFAVSIAVEPPLVSVTGVSPATGPSGGGNSVTITGTGFDQNIANDEFDFGTSPAKVESCTVTSCTVLAPPGASEVDVTATVGGLSSFTNPGDKYTYFVPPIVSSVYPPGGDTQGIKVTISGSGFTNATGVYFGNTPALGYVVNSDNSITATAPGSANPATVDVVVDTPLGISAVSSQDQYTFYNASLESRTLSESLSYNCTLPLLGNQQVAMSFVASAPDSAIPGEPQFLSNVQASLTLPSSLITEATAQKDLTALSTSVTQFQLTDIGGSPSIVDLGASPYGPTNSGSTSISGTGPLTVQMQPSPWSLVGPFTPSPNSQEIVGGFGDIAMNLDFSGPQGEIPVQNVSCVPSGGTPTFVIPVSRPGYPVIDTIQPSSGPAAGGTLVSIVGSGFTGVSAAYFGGNRGTNLSVTDDQDLTVESPPGSGTVDVTLVGTKGTSVVIPDDVFSYVLPKTTPPAIASVIPNSGPLGGGTQIIVTGSNFTSATAVNFNGVPGTNMVIVSDSEIAVTTPPGSSASAVGVSVASPAGDSPIDSGDYFTYIAPVAPPSVTSLSIHTGPAGGSTAITVTGTGFSTATALYFGNIQATVGIVKSDTSVIVSSPPGIAGSTVDITVVGPGGTSAITSADEFTYTNPSTLPPGSAAPTITSVSPSNGPGGGGTWVTIDGSGFSTATAMYFGNVRATEGMVISDSQVMAISPAGTPDTAVDITVVGPGGTSATSTADRFRYNSSPPVAIITSISPSSGPAAGGTDVIVNGSGFLSGTAVFFGSVQATQGTLYSDNQFEVVAPPGTPGSTVDITVIGPGGTSVASSADQFTYQ